MLYGLIHFPWWGYIIVALILTHITIAGVTIYLHRCQAHRSLDLHPIISHFFRLWLWLTTGMRTKEWVAVHRKHHAFVEKNGDPHSPKVFGIRKVFWEGAELYREEADNNETLEKFGRGCPEDWLERKIYSPHHRTGIFLMLFIDLVLFGLPGISIWGVQMLWIPLWAAGVINGIGHYWGYRNFNVSDMSRNIVPWAIIVGGEELHNNHHTYPNSAKLSVKWWELDLGWVYISILKLFKLAVVHKVPPKLIKTSVKPRVDFDTVYALIQNRFQVLSKYTRDVIFPILHEEKEKAEQHGKIWFKNSRGLFKWDFQFLDEAKKHRLTMLLEKYQSLRLTYQFGEKLKSICSMSNVHRTESLEALKEWCQQAEASRIKVLQDFVMKLRCYTHSQWVFGTMQNDT